MKSIAEIYDNLSAKDAELLEKQAAAIKIAEEEEAAGRIMARGFADEARRYMKLAWAPGQTVPDTGNSLGAVKNFRLGADGKATATNKAGQKLESTPAGTMAPPKMQPPKPPAAQRPQP